MEPLEDGLSSIPREMKALFFSPNALPESAQGHCRFAESWKNLHSDFLMLNPSQKTKRILLPWIKCEHIYQSVQILVKTMSRNFGFR